MANLVPNATSNPNHFAAPLPFVGLYIAAGTVACFLAILFDVIRAIPPRWKWIPCHYFKLNSVSLTLVAIAAKLPVDLTTEMPSSLDQFSKITSSALVCVCLCFLYPSIGLNRVSESIGNLVSLSIFVITVVVNISMQMSTGLIFSFIPEHFILMSFMLVLLLLFWVSIFYINGKKVWDQTYKIRFPPEETIIDGDDMFLKLKNYFKWAYSKEYQFVLCRDMNSGILSVVSLSCLIIVLEISIRGLKQDGYRFFIAKSDYHWSIWTIVVSQILLILLGSLATTFRGLTLLTTFRVEPRSALLETAYFSPCYSVLEIIHCASKLRSPSLLHGVEYVKDRLYDVFKIIICGLYLFTFGILLLILLAVILILISKIHPIDIDVWLPKQCDYEIGTWRKTKKPSSQILLLEVLSKSPSSSTYPRESDKPMLDLVMLESIASLCMPSSRSSCLTQILSQLFDIIRFVDTRLYTADKSLNDALNEVLRTTFKISSSQSDLPELIVAGLIIEDFTRVLQTPSQTYHLGFDGSVLSKIVDRQSERINRLWGSFEQHFSAIMDSQCKSILQRLSEICDRQERSIQQRLGPTLADGSNESIKEKMRDIMHQCTGRAILLRPDGPNEQHLIDTEYESMEQLLSQIIMGSIDRSPLIVNRRPVSVIIANQYRSIEELSSEIEKLFAGILRQVLVQFPKAIEKEINETSVDDRKEKVRYLLKLLCQEDASGTQWYLPVGCAAVLSSQVRM